MNAERDQLSMSLQTISAKHDAANKSVWEKEISIQKKMDQVTQIIYNFYACIY